MPLDGTLATSDPSINVVVVYNPFDLSQRATHRLDWIEGRTLADYLSDLPDGIEWAVTVNADVIEPDRWAGVRPAVDDWIVLMPVPEGGGGGGGKSVVRMVAMLAIAVAAPQVAAGLGFAAGTFGYAAVTVGVARCGSLVVGRL